MTWTSRYQSATLSVWRGRDDAPPRSSMFQIVSSLDLTGPIKPAGSLVFAVLGFCSDEGVKRNQGRAGAALAPAVIREVFARMPLHRESVTLYDAGDILCEDGDLESSQTALGEAVLRLHAARITPLVIGGGHEVAYGHYLGIAASFPGKPIGLINIDAHLDMRPLLAGDRGSSGTPFLQIANHRKHSGQALNYCCIGAQKSGNTAALFTEAKQHKVRVIHAEEIELGPSAALAQELENLPSVHPINYLTTCLDAFAAAHAPGVSAPQPFGLSPWRLLPWLRRWAKSGRIYSYDIAELCPPLDQDLRTARLAAQWLFEIIHHHQNPQISN